MQEKFIHSTRVRQLRWRLIKDGFSEDDADGVLEELRKEFIAATENSSERRRFFSEKLGWYIARKMHGQEANPQHLERVATRYEKIIFALSIWAIGKFLDEGISAISETVREIRIGLPSASVQDGGARAPIPPRVPIPPRAPIPPTGLPPRGPGPDVGELKYDNHDLLIFVAGRSATVALGGCAITGHEYHAIERSWDHLKQRIKTSNSRDVIHLVESLDAQQLHLLAEYFINHDLKLVCSGGGWMASGGAAAMEVSSWVDMQFEHRRIHRAQWIIEYADQMYYELVNPANMFSLHYLGPTEAGNMWHFRKVAGEAGLEIAKVVSCVFENEMWIAPDSCSDLMRTIFALGGRRLPQPTTP